MMNFSRKKLQKLQNTLRLRKEKVTVAESCTGGLIASIITSLSGSSDIFDGSIVTYSNEIKRKELNVCQENLYKYGAVSIEVVHEMLNGVIQKFNSDYAIAVSGIAGPNGGTKDKPVGTVIIGVKNKNGKAKIKKYYFHGSRIKIQREAAKKALKKVWNLIKNS